jgi:hypothetical protein
MAQAPARAASAVRLFDVHCHLQDPRIVSTAPALIRAAAASGVARFAVNGTSEVRLRTSSPATQSHKHTDSSLLTAPLIYARAEGLAPGEADGRGLPSRHPLLRLAPMVSIGDPILPISKGLCLALA